MNRSSLFLILANTLPILGVTLLDWSVFDILIVYWTETVIIGAINVKRMAKSQPNHLLSGIAPFDPDLVVGRAGLAKLPTQLFTVMKLGMIAFFVVHYGMFCFGHLFGVLILFAEPDESSALSLSFQTFWQPEYWAAVIPIALSHTFSYFNNFVGKVEYKNIGLFALMRRPYGRILTMHVVIIAGGFFVQSLGSPQLVVIVLVLIKTAIDLRSHNVERRKLTVTSNHIASGRLALQNDRDAPHSFLFGNWKVVSQQPNQRELMKMMMNSVDIDMHDVDELSTSYLIGEHDIVISMHGAPVLGGVTRMRYQVEGNRMILKHRSSGLLSRMLKAYQPDYFEFNCHGSELELVSSPIAGYNNEQIKYRLNLVD